ncbi:MAG: hypothetical protein R3C18_01860 [Planctomycetaceae bacterium]
MAQPAEKPVKDLYGGIEIGSSGVKTTILTTHEDGSLSFGKETKVKNPDTSEDIQLVTQISLGNAPAEAVLNDLRSTVLFAIEQLTVAGVTAPNIRVVISSGVVGSINSDMKNKVSEVLRSAMNEKGVSAGVDEVDYIREMELLAKITAVELKAKAGTAGFDADVLKCKSPLVMDMGTGNFKYCVYDLRGPLKTSRGEEVRYTPLGAGVKDVEDRIANGYTRDLAIENAEKRFRLDLDAVATRVSGNQTDSVFLSGGVVWCMLALEQPEDSLSPFTRIRPQTFALFMKRMEESGTDVEAVFKARSSAVAGSEAEAAAQQIIVTCRDRINMTPNGLRLAASNFRDIANAFKLADKPGGIWFYRDAYLGWIRGYLAEVAESETAVPPAPPETTEMSQLQLQLDGLRIQLDGLRTSSELSNQNTKALEGTAKLLEVKLEALRSEVEAIRGQLETRDTLGRIEETLKKMEEELKRQPSTSQINTEKRDPTLAHLLVARALREIRYCRFDIAINILAKACEADSKNAFAWYYKGTCEVAVGRIEEAKASAEMAGTILASSSHRTYIDIHQSLERVQSPRVVFDTLVLDVAPTAARY